MFRNSIIHFSEFTVSDLFYPHPFKVTSKIMQIMTDTSIGYYTDVILFGEAVPEIYKNITVLNMKHFAREFVFRLIQSVFLERDGVFARFFSYHINDVKDMIESNMMNIYNNDGNVITSTYYHTGYHLSTTRALEITAAITTAEAATGAAMEKIMPSLTCADTPEVHGAVSAAAAAAADEHKTEDMGETNLEGMMEFMRRYEGIDD